MNGQGKRDKGRRKSPSNRIARLNGRQARSETAIAGGIASPTGPGGSHLSQGSSAYALVDAAKKLFAQKGYDGTSVKELSDAAGTNIALVSYHFGGKEGLYRACLGQFGEASRKSVERILQKPKTPEELSVRLGLFVDFMFDTFTSDPELSQLVFKEADLETGFVRDIFQESFLTIFKMIVDFFSGAKTEGLIRGDLDPHTVSSLFFGSLSHYARMDKIGNRYFGRTIHDPKVRARVVEHLKSIFLRGLTTQE